MTADLRRHLLDSRISGEVDTSRESNLRNIDRMLAGADGAWFGLTHSRDWSAAEVLQVMVEQVGIRADPAYRSGTDTIDPDLTIAALVRWRERLELAVRRRERVLIATGHPSGVFQLHLDVAAALEQAGCEVLRPDVHDWLWPWDIDNDWTRRRPRHLRCLGGVHVLAAGGDVHHTHAPEPGRVLLEACSPDLVIADHGFAGAALTAGHEVLALADCNDPALFVAQAEGRPVVTVPLDDNVRPHLYAPLSDFLLAGLLGTTQQR